MGRTFTLKSRAKTDRQRQALENAGLRTVEDLLRKAADETSAETFTVGMDKVFDVCNRDLHHILIHGEDLKRDCRVTIHGKRPRTFITFSTGRTDSTTTHVTDDDDLFPPEWFCPLTHEVFKRPVFLSDGYTYDEASIREWLTRSTLSPMTGECLGNEPSVVPNRSMRDWIARLTW